jgi:hypothetical protein
MQSLASKDQNLVNLFNDFVVIIIRINLHRYVYGFSHEPNIANKHFLVTCTIPKLPIKMVRSNFPSTWNVALKKDYKEEDWVKGMVQWQKYAIVSNFTKIKT